HAAGTVGYKLFGMVMWAAAATSIVGAAYTSVSFLRSFSRILDRHHQWVIIAFILISTLVFIAVGRPVKVLILVGALNGLILPLALSVILIAAYQKRIVGTYRHPVWLAVFGGVVVIAMAYLGMKTLTIELPKLLQ
ncbi:MAG: hypothetical protein L5657_03415, partial [Calditerricola sp.]|nr:hypothetical protein [Calditerricola sp.]